MFFSGEHEPIGYRQSKGVDTDGYRNKPQRSWKCHRNNRYRRITGLTAKQVNKYINFCIKFNLESRFKRASL